MLKVIKTIDRLRAWRKSLDPSLVVGFVPTMGALHKGHATLLREARLKADILVLSIYINQTQFNDPKDFEKYPNTWDSDLRIAESEKVDVIFAPSFSEIYPDGYKYKVTENDLSQKLCGEFRPGHFDGVLSVVMKLFNIVKPNLAFFGEKDFQQLNLIQGMVQAFFMDLKIVPVATVREKDGLAMSSRNLRLNPEERALAPKLYQIISSEPNAIKATEMLNKIGFKVDYIVDDNHRRFAAAYLGPVRLIDNVEI